MVWRLNGEKTEIPPYVSVRFVGIYSYLYIEFQLYFWYNKEIINREIRIYYQEESNV